MSMNYPPAAPVPGSSPAQPSPVTWAVLSQNEVVQPDSTGKLVSGRRIVFALSTGDTGSVFVPDAQYNVEAVTAAIQAKVAIIAGVGGLSGSSPGVRSN